MKKVLVVVLSLAMIIGVLATAGCSSKNSGSSGNEDAILIVSFGTSYNESRNVTIGAIEAAIAEAYPSYDVRRAFTAQTIIDILKNREGIAIDNVTEALDRAVADGVKNLIVQPTHLMDGLEYGDIKEEVEKYTEKFDSIKLAEPLLNSDEDYDKVMKAIVEDTKEYDDGKTAICYMGHGTTADSNKIYENMQKKLADAGYNNYFIGTVEAAPTLDDVIALVKKGDYERVVLLPLMVVAGDHATNDMAGDEEDTWKTAFKNAGYEVVPVLRGLGQLYPIQQIYVQHVKDIMESK